MRPKLQEEILKFVLNTAGLVALGALVYFVLKSINL